MLNMITMHSKKEVIKEENPEKENPEKENPEKENPKKENPKNIKKTKFGYVDKIYQSYNNGLTWNLYFEQIRIKQ